MLLDYDSQLAAANIEAGLSQSSPAGAPHANTTQSVLLWDAVYTAAGVSSSILGDRVDFSSWFSRSLLPSLTLLCGSNSSNAPASSKPLPVLLHRIVWLLGCWIHALTDSLRPPVYAALVAVLQDSSGRPDARVKLSCVQTLNAACEDWDFLAPAFAPLAATAIQGLYRLLQTATELESLALCLETTRVIVARMGADLPVDALNAAVTPLPSIWSGTGSTHQILRSHVLSILAAVAAVVAPTDAVLLYPVALPMLQAAIGGTGDPSSDHVHLADDALKLTLTLMRIAATYEENFHVLFPKIAQMVITGDWEHLRVCMMLLELYILNGGATFLAAHAASVTEMLVKTIGNVKTKAAGLVMLGVDALLRKFPAEGGKLLVDGGCVHVVLKCCHHVVRERKEREPDVCLVQWMSVLARVLLGNPAALNAMMSQAGSQDGNGGYCFVVEEEGEAEGEEEEQEEQEERGGGGGRNGAMNGEGVQESAGILTCQGLIRLFFEKFDCVGYGGNRTGKVRRKLWCLFLASLLPTAEGGGGDEQKLAREAWGGSLLGNMDSFVNLSVDVLTELKSDAEDRSGGGGGGGGNADDSYSSVVDYDSEEETIHGGQEQYEQKLRDLSRADCVVEADLKGYVRGKMEACCALLGEARWNEAVTDMCEPAVLAQLMALLR